MLRRKTFGKDHCGAVLLIALGLGALALGVGYRMGTLNQMGAGFIPVVLGALMILVGVAIGATATSAANEPPGNSPHGARPAGLEWRGWICILGGVLAFAVCGLYGGLVPATFASVFIAAMGDRQNNVKKAGLLAAFMVAFCVVVFHYGLQLQLPLFQWG